MIVSHSLPPRPNVSVVIAHHNRPNLLERAINSALLQGSSILEIIVIDDGSTERITQSTIDFYSQDPRIKFFLETTNCGQSTAKNKGIIKSTGEYIAILDDDDEWLPEKISRQLSFIEENNFDICACEFIIIETSGRQRAVEFPKFNGDPTKYILNEDGHLQTSTFLIRAAVAKNLLIDSTLKKFTDWDFLFRAQHAGYKIGMLHSPLSLYRFDAGGNISSTLAPALAFEYIKSHRHLISDRISFRFAVCGIAQMHRERREFLSALRVPFKAINEYGILDAISALRSILSTVKYIITYRF